MYATREECQGLRLLRGRKKDGVDQQFADVYDEEEDDCRHLPIEEPFGGPHWQRQHCHQQGYSRGDRRPFKKLPPLSFLHRDQNDYILTQHGKCNLAAISTEIIELERLFIVSLCRRYRDRDNLADRLSQIYSLLSMRGIQSEGS